MKNIKNYKEFNSINEEEGLERGSSWNSTLAPSHFY